MSSILVHGVSHDIACITGQPLHGGAVVLTLHQTLAKAWLHVASWAWVARHVQCQWVVAR